MHSIKLIITLFLFLFFTSIHVSYSQHLNSRIIKKAEDDAAILAIRILDSEQNLKDQNVLIPEELVSKLKEGLLAINQSDFQQTPLVTKYLNIHPSKIYELNKLIIELPSTILVEEDEFGKVKSNLSELDKQLNTYDFKVADKKELDTLRIQYTLISNKPLNISALERQLSTIDGVFISDKKEERKEIWKDIHVKAIENSLLFTYVFKWGENDHTKYQFHQWQFLVNSHGVVTFKGESGDPLPQIR